VYRFYFARCMNILNSLLAQLVKYDVHTTRKIKVDTHYFLSHIIILLLERWCRIRHHALCFVKIKAGVRAYSVSAAIDKISLRILI